MLVWVCWGVRDWRVGLDARVCQDDVMRWMRVHGGLGGFWWTFYFTDLVCRWLWPSTLIMQHFLSS